MADTEIIPVIDLGPYLAGAPGAIDRAAGELRFALTEIGFYFIANHGVPSGQIREVFRQVARFHAQPLEKKLEIKLDKHNVGYLPMKGDTLRTSSVERPCCMDQPVDAVIPGPRGLIRCGRSSGVPAPACG